MRSFARGGYLFLGTELVLLQKQTQIQRSFGAEVDLLETEEVKKLIPDLNLIARAALAAGLGITYRNGILQDMTGGRAKSLGGIYVHAEVVSPLAVRIPTTLSFWRTMSTTSACTYTPPRDLAFRRYP